MIRDVPPCGTTFAAGPLPRSNFDIIRTFYRVPQEVTYVVARYNADGTRDASLMRLQGGVTVSDGLAVAGLFFFFFSWRYGRTASAGRERRPPARYDSSYATGETYTLRPPAARKSGGGLRDASGRKTPPCCPRRRRRAGEPRVGPPGAVQGFGDAPAAGAAIWFVRIPRASDSVRAPIQDCLSLRHPRRRAAGPKAPVAGYRRGSAGGRDHSPSLGSCRAARRTRPSGGGAWRC